MYIEPLIVKDLYIDKTLKKEIKGKYSKFVESVHLSDSICY